MQTVARDRKGRRLCGGLCSEFNWFAGLIEPVALTGTVDKVWHNRLHCNSIAEYSESASDNHFLSPSQIDDNQQTLTIEDRQFTFDRVFNFDSTQIDVYTKGNGSAKQIVDSVLHGYNGKILAIAAL